MSKWVATIIGGVLTAVIAGVILMNIQNGDESRPPNRPPRGSPKSFLEQLAGNYRFQSWRSTSGLTGSKLIPRSGTLSIAADGRASWQIRFEPRSTTERIVSVSGKRLLCDHKLSAVVSVSDEKLKETHASTGWPNGFPEGIGSAAGTRAGPEAMSLLNAAKTVFGQNMQYSLALDPGRGRTILQCTSPRGVMTWIKDA